MWTFVKATLAILASSFLLAQSSSPVEFEVASIRPTGPLMGQQTTLGLHVDGAQVTCNRLSLKDYLEMAYKVKRYQVEGPEWLAGQRFDIAAKLPEGTTRAQVPEMLQALLRDRFKVQLHREMKTLPVYGLVIGKGELKVKESAPEPTGGNVNVAISAGRGGVGFDLGGGAFFSMANNKMEAHKITMTGFADSLGRFCDRPVVDMTGMNGHYDITLDFTPEDFRAMMIRSAINAGVSLPPDAMRAMENANGDSLFTAVEAIGLKLDHRKAPIEMLVIDHIEKTPTEN